MSMQLWKTVIKTIKVRNCVHDKEKERKDDHKSNFAYLFCIGKKRKKGTETKHPTTSLNCSARHLLRNTPRPVRFLSRAGRIRHPLVARAQALLPRA